MPRAQVPSPPELRKSCAFCRKRKIRCSGEFTGCKACLSRTQPCIYETSAPMGRPRKNNLSDGGSITPDGGSYGLDGLLLRRDRGQSMSRRALDLAGGEADSYFPKTSDLPADSATGMLKLRQSSNVRSTFPLFSTETVGSMAISFYALVSSSATAPPPTDSASTFGLSYRAPQGTRFLYELAFQTRNASRRKSEGSIQIVKEAMTLELWRRFPSELVSLSTAGIPSSYDSNIEESLFVRLLQEDESTSFDYPLTQGQLGNPLRTLPPTQLHLLITRWFIHSPYAFFLNDAHLLEAIASGTQDDALLSILVGISISIDPSKSLDSPPPSPVRDPTNPASYYPGGLPPSAFEQPGPNRAPRRDPTPFIQYGQQLLFERSAVDAARSVSTVHALLILGAYHGSNHRTRQCWSVMSSGYALARESLKRIQAMSEGDRLRRSKRQLIEDEQLINVIWMFAIFGSWSFLSLDLPRSTLIDITDSLTLPPFAHHHSLSYTYRSSATPRISECEAALKKGIHGFNETCRTLALVVMFSIKNGIQSPETSPTGGHRPFEYPLVADSRLASQGVFNVQVAKWLVQTAEDHASPETAAKRKTETSSTGKPVVPSIFLSCVHAIMALHRLAPFNQPSKTVVLSAGGLKLSLRAIELLVSGTRENIQSAMHEGNGKVLPDTAKAGLLRLLCDALPHCLRLMDHVAESAKSSSEVYALVYEEQLRIAKLLQDLIFLTETGITAAGEDSTLGAKRVQYSLVAGLHMPRSETPKRPYSPSPPSEHDSPSSPPRVWIPLPPAVPYASHYRSLSGDSVASSSRNAGRSRSGSSSSLSYATSLARSRSRSGSSTRCSATLRDPPPPYPDTSAAAPTPARIPSPSLLRRASPRPPPPRVRFTRIHHPHPRRLVIVVHPYFDVVVQRQPGPERLHRVVAPHVVGCPPAGGEGMAVLPLVPPLRVACGGVRDGPVGVGDRVRDGPRARVLAPRVSV